MLAEAVAGYDLTGVRLLLFDASDGAEQYLAHFLSGEPASVRFDALKDGTLDEAVSLTGVTLNWTYPIANGFRSWKVLCGIGAEYYARERSNIETLTFFSLFGMDYSTTLLIMLLALLVKYNADRVSPRRRNAEPLHLSGSRPLLVPHTRGSDGPAHTSHSRLGWSRSHLTAWVVPVFARAFARAWSRHSPRCAQRRSARGAPSGSRR